MAGITLKGTAPIQSAWVLLPDKDVIEKVNAEPSQGHDDGAISSDEGSISPVLMLELNNLMMMMMHSLFIMRKSGI